MAEVITEMILPGTYIEVRAEGLLTIGAISTGNVGVLGTAEMGSGGVQILSSFEEGRAKFGDVGTWDETDPQAIGGNLSLVRALRLIFDNGARTVYARRVYDPKTAKPASYDLGSGVVLRAKTPGTWGNRLQIRIEGIDGNQLISNEEIVPSNGALVLSAQAQSLPPPETPDASMGSVTVREHGLVKKYQLKQAPPTSDVVQVNPDNLRLGFVTTPDPAAQVFASYWVAKDKLCKVTLRYGNMQEEYLVPSLAYLVQRLQQDLNPSQLVEVMENSPKGPLNLLPQATLGFVPFSKGDNGSLDASHFQDALEDMVEQNIQLLLVAGLDFSTLKAPLLGHIEKTENLGRERLVVLGANQSKVEKVLENANEVADKRVVLVAPGIKQTDPATGRMTALPPYFSAAAITGKLSSQSPHISLTNKTLAGIEALDTRYNYGQLASLLQNRVLALQTKQGVRVVKGITSDDGAFKQISIRRIIDYIKEGTRLGCNQYIGKLNNRRVRGNLFTTLDSFLADLIVREFLTNYKLNVFADRAMEIRGEVQVVMDLQPTFSIDYIRVIMNLS